VIFPEVAEKLGLKHGQNLSEEQFWTTLAANSLRGIEKCHQEIQEQSFPA
jgi:hypothetical protein